MRIPRVATLGGAILVSVLVACSGGAASGASAYEAFCRAGLLAVSDRPVASPAGPADEAGASATTHRLAIYYAVPTDVPFNPAVLTRIKRAAADVQAWYQCATGGRTWTFAYPETVRVYNAQHTRLYYKNNGDWWGSLPSEMSSAGKPIWAPGVVTAIWAHGAGWWAGGAWGCGAECGIALLGVELFPEFNDPAYSGNTCPSGSGVSAWPCTPEGAFAHELGHTVQLAHPADVPATATVAGHSIMQTHWNYPDFASGSEVPWGFLTLERQTLMASAFMIPAVSLNQVHSDCDIVNLPASGSVPTAGFTRDLSQPSGTFAATNTSTGAASYYWTYGDGTGSTSTDALHTYGQNGSYTILLRAVGGNAMIDMAAAPFVNNTVGVSRPPGPPRVELMLVGPDPGQETTTFQLRLAAPSILDLAVFDATGRRVRMLAQGYRPAGTFVVDWDGLDDAGRAVQPGVYFGRLRVGVERALVRFARIN